MPRIKQLGKIIASAIAYLALGTLIVPVARADRRPVFLLRTTCVDTGVGNWNREKADVAIGKAVYTSLFYMGSADKYASLTCKIAPDNFDTYFKTLELGFGMRDNDRRSPSVDVNVFLDKKKVETKTVRAGERASLSLNVANVRDVSIETICSGGDRYCDRVYFYKATLEPLPAPPVQKK